MKASPQDIRAEILRLTTARGPDKTICPSEVARSLAPGEDWRELMDSVRSEAVELLASGHIHITQGGEPVDDLQNLSGPIRLQTTGNE